MKVTVVIQIFDNSAQEPGSDDVYVFKTNKSKDEIVNGAGVLRENIYKFFRKQNEFLYESLLDNDYEVIYISDSEIENI